MKDVIIYTDGACSGNPGPGGWAAILQYGPHERVLSGAEPQTTNNRMELRAALEALRALKEPVENKDLWEGLIEETNRHEVSWIKVKGHADNALNNRVDGLAVEAMNLGRYSGSY